MSVGTSIVGCIVSDIEKKMKQIKVDNSIDVNTKADLLYGLQLARKIAIQYED